MTFDNLDNDLQEIIQRIESYSIGNENVGDNTGKLKFKEIPKGKAVDNTDNSIEVTTMAIDEYENAELTYTLWVGIESGKLLETDIKTTGITGENVILTITDLNPNTIYYFKVIASNGLVESSSMENSTRTFCKGEYCKRWHREISNL